MTIRSISSLKRAGEDMFRYIFEGMKDPILLLCNGEFIDCNSATVDMLGYGSTEELLHRRPGDLSPPTQPDGRPSADKAAEMIATALEDGFHRFEWVHLKVDGTPIDVEVTLTPITVGGQVILHTQWRDISAQKQADQDLRRSEAKLRAIYDTTTDAVMLLDTVRFLDCNRAALALFGCGSEVEFCAKHPADLSPPLQPCGTSSAILADRMIAQALERGAHRFQWVHRRADTDAQFLADVQLTAMDLDGRRVLQAVVRDMSERIQVETALRTSEALLRTIFDTSSVAIFSINHQGLIGFANRRMAEMFALPLERLVGASYGSLVEDSEQDQALANMRRHLDGDLAKVSLERRYRCGDGSTFWGHLTANRMPELEGGSPSLVCVVADITDRKQAEQALEERATRDRLTGAINRYHMEELINQDLLRLERYCHPISLIFFDLDHFKAINDTFGHAAGDTVLREVCALVRRCMRATDMLARWGGEEFLITMPSSGLGVACTLAERIRAAVAARPFPLVGQVTASFGVAECRMGESWESWLARADGALYAAKQAGRNRVVADRRNKPSGPPEAGNSSFLRLVWHCSYNSGHSDIDDRHSRLFDQANSLLDAIVGNRPKGEAVELIEAMLADLADHFAVEEQIFLAAGYEGAQRHIALHRDIGDKAAQLLADFRADRLNAGDIFAFVAHDVVDRHMLLEDQKAYSTFTG